MFLLPSLMTGIESLGAIWWKERDGSYQFSSDLHVCTVASMYTHTLHTHTTHTHYTQHNTIDTLHTQTHTAQPDTHTTYTHIDTNTLHTHM